MKLYKYSAFISVSLLCACSEQASLKPEPAHRTISDTLKDNIAKSPEVQKSVVEEEPGEAFFIQEGGDIQEFDEEGNPIEE